MFKAKQSKHDATHNFEELFIAPGPADIGVPGDSFADSFGYAWALVFSREDFVLRVYRWHPETNEWVERQENLPEFPTFSGRERRFSFAFDQSGRIVYAYEGIDRKIRITRWDAVARAYVQDVIFTGTNPVLFMDALISSQVSDSDVLCFYQTTNRQAFFVRKQRDVYADAGQVPVTPGLGQPSVLDRVVTGALRYQLRLTDDSGQELTALPSSAPYPYAPSVQVAGAGELQLELRDIVQLYESSIEVAGSGELRLELISVVTTYNSQFDVRGDGELRLELIDIVTTYQRPEITLDGDGELRLELDTVATRYEPPALELTGAGELLLTLESV